MTLSHVCIATVAVDKQFKYYECVCSLRYLACKAHALFYTVIWHVWLYLPYFST